MSKTSKTSKLCLVMMVKDESHIITDTLEHLFPYIEYCVIADTGSTDSTPEQIKEVCKSFNIPYTLVHHYWINFGQNRTQVLDLAHGLRDTHQCDYYLMFDADDMICGELPIHKLGKADAYYCTLQLGSIVYNRLMFFRCDFEWGYKGVLHEYPYNKKTDTFITELLVGDYHIQANSRGISARNKQPEKYTKDAHVLIEALSCETDPILISRYIFYIARSFMDAKDYTQAIEYFELYLNDSTRWYEERFESQMCIGYCKIYSNDHHTSVQQAMINAWIIDPIRVEPFYELARFYRLRQHYSEAYAFACMGKYILQSNNPSTPKRNLFVQKEVYEYALLDELAVAAYWTGRKQECLEICTYLLTQKNIPETERLRIQENIGYCI